MYRRVRFHLRTLEARFRYWFDGLGGAQRVLVLIGLAFLGLFLLLNAVWLMVLGLVVGLLALLIQTWFDEIVWLMRQPDDVFPGRFDKPVWALLLVFLPPVGVLALSSFRRSLREKPAKPRMSWWD